MADSKQFANVPANLQGKMERCVLRLKADGKSKSQAIAICFSSIVEGKDIGEIIEMNAKQRRKLARRQARALKRAKDKRAAGEPLSHEELRAEAEATFNETPTISEADAKAEMAQATRKTFDPIEITKEPEDPMENTRSTTEVIEPAPVVEKAAPKPKPKPEPETLPVPEAKKEVEEKDHLVAVSSLFAGGATTFEAMDAFREAQDDANELRGVVWDFEMLVDNVLATTDAPKVGAKIAALGKAMEKRIKVSKEIDESVNEIEVRIGKSAADKFKSWLTGKIKPESEPVKETSGIRVTKGIDGKPHWFGWVSNKFRDRDVPAEPKLGGQIITEQAHKDFVQWVYQDPSENMPQLWPWHLPEGAHKSRADWIDYADGFLVMSGSLTEKEAELLTGLGEEYDLAMSHGLIRSDHHYDKERGLIQKYRTFEASYLPREFAANEWTDIQTIAKEVIKMGFTPERRDFLVTALGEEEVMKLESDTEGRGKALDELGVEWKGIAEVLESIESGPDDEDENEPAEVVEDQEEALEPVPAKDLEQLEGLNEYLETQAETQVSHGKAIEAIAVAVEGLVKSDDEKIAKAIRPKNDVKEMIPVWQRSETKSEDNVIDEDDADDKELADSKPGEDRSDWIEETMGAGIQDLAAVPRN